jgi:hypothetical protein
MSSYFTVAGLIDILTRGGHPDLRRYGAYPRELSLDIVVCVQARLTDSLRHGKARNTQTALDETT